jgi:plasmid stabilization system protein ParE
MIVRWTPKAEKERSEILEYIAADNPGAAAHMNELFLRHAASWRRF